MSLFILLYSVCTLPTLLISGVELTNDSPFVSNRNADSESREYPFMAAIMFMDMENEGAKVLREKFNWHVIGGAVIFNEKSIVTAASIFDDFHLVDTNCMMALVGSNYINGLMNHSILDSKPSAVIRHNEYKRYGDANIAVLPLTANQINTANPVTKCVCNPEPLGKYHLDRCKVLGWRFYNQVKMGWPDKMCAYDATIVANVSSEEVVGAYINDQMHDEECLFEGSPLVCRNKQHPNAFILVGINNGRPIEMKPQMVIVEMYTRVYKYYNWLEQACDESPTPTVKPDLITTGATRQETQVFIDATDIQQQSSTLQISYRFTIVIVFIVSSINFIFS